MLLSHLFFTINTKSVHTNVSNINNTEMFLITENNSNYLKKHIYLLRDEKKSEFLTMTRHEYYKKRLKITTMTTHSLIQNRNYVV